MLPFMQIVCFHLIADMVELVKVLVVFLFGRAAVVTCIWRWWICRKYTSWRQAVY